MTKKRCLLLWDVDHTLIENGGVSKETYALAFEILVGRTPTSQPRTDGLTDYLIMRNLFEANAVDLSPSYESKLFDVLSIAMDRNAKALASRGHILPGVLDAISELDKIDQVMQSVLTGNIVHNARVKLGAFDLDARFDMAIGGYGSDARQRHELVGAAQRKASAAVGFWFDRSSTLLVGDTPMDVQAGITGGARVLAVATGTYTSDELRNAGADVVLPDLVDTQMFVRLVRLLMELGE